MERDDETGLSRHGVRMYAGWLGRWASADPSGMKDGVNRYAYVRGNPIRGVDGTGRATLFDLTKEYANAALPAFGETLAAPFVAIGSASTQIAGAYAETYEKATTEGLVAAGQHAASTTAKNYVAGVKSVPGIAYASTVGLAQEVGTSAGNVTAAYIQLAVGDDQGALESARAAGESGGKVAGVAALTAATVGAVKGTARALAPASAEEVALVEAAGKPSKPPSTPPSVPAAPDAIPSVPKAPLPPPPPAKPAPAKAPAPKPVEPPPQSAGGYTIGEGVRRSLAAKTIGRETIPGRVLGPGGQVGPVVELPLSELRVANPTKLRPAFRPRLGRGLQYYIEGIETGAAPPIEVTQPGFGWTLDQLKPKWRD